MRGRSPAAMLRLSVPLLLLFLWRPLRSAAVPESSVFLPAPQDLRIDSYNFQNVLRWSPVKGINGTVSYNVSLRVQSEQHWEKVNCTDITKTECEFDYKYFYRVILRVRAEQEELKSNWTETGSFQAKSNTTLGPPRKINITTEPGLLVVRFLPPFEHSAYFPAFEYSIDYWEKSTSKTLTKYTVNTEYSFKDLKERTEYCFQIKAELRESHKTGGKSDPYCKQTATTEATTIFFVTLILGFAVFVFVAIFLCLIVIRKYRSTIKSFWQAPLIIPSHFEEDLQNPEMMVEEFQKCAGEDHWDIVSVISNAEQSQTVTNSFTNENQQVDLLKVEEHR